MDGFNEKSTEQVQQQPLGCLRRFSKTIKVIIIGGLIILLMIPMFMIEDLISERGRTQEEAINEVSEKWSLAQTITGPYLNIQYPVTTENKGEKKVTIKDQEGEAISINIVYIDDLYLENPSYRYLIAGSSSYQSVSTSTVGSITHSEEFNMSEIVIKGTGTYASGFAVQFTGDLTKGNKGDAVLYKVTRNAVDKKVKYPIEDCRIDKVEDGWYWVSFLEPNCTIRSYMITKQ